MASTDKALKVLTETLASIEDGLAGRKTEISKAYKEGIALAEKNFKEAKAKIEKTFKESQLEFATENAEIAKLKNAIKALTGESAKATKPVKATGGTAPANFTVPRTYDEAKSDNQKIYFAISELGSGTVSEILVKVNGYGAAFDTKGVNNAVGNLKRKFQVITEDGKVGKAFKYKIS